MRLQTFVPRKISQFTTCADIAALHFKGKSAKVRTPKPPFPALEPLFRLLTHRPAQVNFAGAYEELIPLLEVASSEMVVDSIRRQSQGAARGLLQAAKSAAKPSPPAAVELAPEEGGAAAGGGGRGFDIADLHFSYGDALAFGEASLFGEPA